MKVFGLQGGLYRLARLGWRRKTHDDPDGPEPGRGSRR